MSPLFKHHISGQEATTSQLKSLLPGPFPEHVASVNTLTVCTMLNNPSCQLTCDTSAIHPQVRSNLSLTKVITIGIKFHPLNELQS